MTPEQHELIKSLCERIVKEQDPQKFRELVQELGVWLDHFLAVRCVICDKPISLEESKVTEDGKPVHEDCYVAKITGKLPNPQ
jgi:hypothetical protein